MEKCNTKRKLKGAEIGVFFDAEKLYVSPIWQLFIKNLSFCREHRILIENLNFYWYDYKCEYDKNDTCFYMKGYYINDWI
jgi:hypothetical protein